MYNRACRILQTDASVPQNQPPHMRTTPHRLTIHQVVSRWRCLILRVSLIFQMIAQRSKVKMLLGQEVFNLWFSPAVQETTSRASQPTLSRVIKGQAVGRRLPMGEGEVDKQKAHMDPSMCLHPESSMA